MPEDLNDNQQPDTPVDTSEQYAEAAEAGRLAEDIADDKPKQGLILGLLNRQMRYPNAYAWLLLLSAMDVMLTWVILLLKGREVNPIANWVIKQWELSGMITYKFMLILFFIMICEVIGHMREPTGRFLSRVSVAIAMIPVVWSLYLLGRYAL